MNWINPYAPKGLNKGLPPLIGKGITQAEAARRLGCSRCAVHLALKRLGATMDGYRHRVTGATERGASA